jgi:4'-phosphopantetheinyl transferase
VRGHDDTAESVTVYLARGGGDLRRQARELAVTAAAAVLNQPVSVVRLGRETGGRPLIEVSGAHAADVHIAISHARGPAGTAGLGVVAVAVSGIGPVGVDVEVVRDLPVLALARRWLTATETAWLEARPEPQRAAAFLLLWTQKEAVGKALGTGLRGSGLRRPVPLPGALDLRSGGGAPAGGVDVQLVAAGTTPPAAVAAWLQQGLALAVASTADAAILAPVKVRPMGAREAAGR